MVHSQKPAWILVFILWGSGLGAAAQFAKMAITLQELSAYYSEMTGNLGVTIIVSSIGVVGIFLGATASLIAERLGLKNALVLALLIGSSASIFQGTLPDFSLMLGSRLIEGASHLLIVVAAPALIVLHSPIGHRAFSLGLWSTIFGVAFAIVGGLGLPALEHLGFSNLFYLHGGYMAIVAGCIVAYIPHSRPGTSQKQRITFAVWAETHRQMYTNPRILLPATSYLLHATMFVALLTLLPGHFLYGGVSAFVIFPLATILGTLVAGMVAQAYPVSIRLIPLSFLFLGTMSVLLILVHKNDWAIVMATFVMFASGALQGGIFATIPALCATGRDPIMINAAIAQTGNFGTTVGVPLLAFALVQQGVSGLLAVCILLSSIGIILSIFFVNRISTIGVGELSWR